MIRPTFFVIGAAKAGTTSLSRLLAQHPQICFSKPKEPRFFSHNENYLRGWEWYQAFFQVNGSTRAIGEGSVHYSMVGLFPETASRIARDIPEAKIIYIVRHPMDRIAAHYRMYRKDARLYTSLPILVRKPDLWPNFIGASQYWRQIQVYRNFFPDERIQVLFFDEFFQNPGQAVKACYQFLGVNPDVRPKNSRRRYNSILVEKPFLQAARRLPLYVWISKLIPPEWRAEIRRAYLTKTPPRGLSRWDLDSYRWTADQLEEDASKFLQYCGRPAATWQFEFSG